MSFLINLTGLGARATACKTPASAEYRFDDGSQASLNPGPPREISDLSGSLGGGDIVGTSSLGIGIPRRARMGEGRYQGVAL